MKIHLDQKAQVFSLINLRYSETTALFMLLMVGQLLSYMLWGWYSATHVDYQRFVNVAVVWSAMWFCGLGVLLGLGWGWICLQHRDAAPPTQRFLMCGGLAIFLLIMLFAGWLSGLFAMSLGVVLAGTPFIGMIMFPARAVLITAALAWLAIASMTVATIYFGLPYAPLFKEFQLSQSAEYAAFYFASQFYFVLPFLLLTISTSSLYLKQASRREAQILHLSQTDALTQLYNRRTAQDLMSQMLSRTERRALSVLLLDLDFFKRINDTHGHLVGDRVLIAVAAVLRLGLRQNDVVSRFGGEEFLLILDGMSCNSAKNVAERCRQQIAACVVLDDSGQRVPLSASFGVACVVTGNHPIAVDDVLRQADQALYQAKENGRNQVVGHACPNTAMGMTHPLLRLHGHKSA